MNIAAGQSGRKLSESIVDDLLTITVSSIVIGTVLVFMGLWVSSRANLGAPLLTRIYSKKPLGELINWKDFWSSILLASAIAVVLLGLFELQKELYPIVDKMSRPAKSYYALVSFSAGITEEIIFRLGLMSLIVTIAQVLTSLEKPTNNMVWLGIIISAVFFGLIHLPLSKNFVELTPFTVSVTMIGNLITGTTFGWIFWKRGLLIAIASHVVFDLVFHVLGSPYA